MRRALIVILALAVSACGADEPTLIAGDQIGDSATVTTPVAEDSPPAEVAPTTTEPWDVTLEEYPLLRMLDETANASIGSASFVLVNEDGQVESSGSEAHPAFLVRLDAWYGVANDIEFTVSTSNVALEDGQPSAIQCGSNWAHLTQTPKDSVFLRKPNTLPAVKNTNLAWDSAGCAEYLPVDYDVLFESDVQIEVTTNGFKLRIADALAESYEFAKLDAPSPPASVPTTIAVATTEPPKTTAPPSTDN